ncbi:MAG TPA: glutamyl-tRNA reductase [Acidimicrobiaceae bacterium]|nr:glutamyl-tRNA reductase [Acidimicrobiaceae bacterium]
MGISHATAPLDLLERCAIGSADLPKHLAGLAGHEHISEAVIVSTCNRTEAYVVAEMFHAAEAEMRDFFATTSFTEPDELDGHLYMRFDDDAAAHLFAVASGIESAVVGESEILGQVKSAWATARAEGTCGTLLDQMFRHGVETAKRARTETGIGRGTASVSHAAVAMATQHLGTLAGRRVLVVGAGEMAESMVVALAAAGPSEVLVANRSPGPARELAERVGGRALALSELEQALAEVDVLLTSTGASSVILDYAGVDQPAAKRAGAPLLIVDIAVPRDVDPTVAQIDGVTLLDMDDLSRFAAAGRAERHREIAAVCEVVASEVARYSRLRAARETAPVIAALRSAAESVRVAELERTLALDADWTPAQREAVARMSKSMMAKLLHRPTVTLREEAGRAKGDRLADSVRDLFDL